jgi:hypothetical protein
MLDYNDQLENQMPVDSLLVSIGVCAMFLIFAFAVAWADHMTTSQWLRSRAATKQATTDTEPPYRKAA